MKSFLRYANLFIVIQNMIIVAVGVIDEVVEGYYQPDLISVSMPGIICICVYVLE